MSWEEHNEGGNIPRQEVGWSMLEDQNGGYLICLIPDTLNMPYTRVTRSHYKCVSLSASICFPS